MEHEKDWSMKWFNLGNLNNFEEFKKNFFDTLVKIYVNQINESNDLSFFYYELVDKWNGLLYDINQAENVLDMFKCAEQLFENSENYQMLHSLNYEYIRIYIDEQENAHLIAKPYKFNTKNLIYITKNELNGKEE